MITLNVPNNILFIFCYFLADSANVYFGPLLIFCQNTRRSKVGIYLVVLQKHYKSIISVNSQRNGHSMAVVSSLKVICSLWDKFSYGIEESVWS